ncbi:MAG: glycosyltransferase family 2 protein [Bacteroidales bacterium]|nr:glycosyltransferase family 2 protein [Bacteroidales bacterium]
MNTQSCNLSIVISVYNEQDNIKLMAEKVTEILKDSPLSYEIIFVNDGSHDNSYNELLAIAGTSPNIKVINFSRNFGHEAAMIAGIDKSNGEKIICMDCDLQHPPKLIPKMIEEADKGYDIITMVRTKRTDSSHFYNFFSKLFYKIINRMSRVKMTENASDFFLISKDVAEILRNDYRERTRFLRWIIQMVGFNKTNLEYQADDRHSGTSKYSLSKLITLSFSAILSFSKTPLRLGIISGIFFLLVSFILLISYIVMWIIGQPVHSSAIIILVITIFAGVQLLVSGFIAQYVGLIFDEVKKRPIYTIKDTINFNS